MIEGRWRTSAWLSVERVRVTNRPDGAGVLRLGATDRVMVIAPHPDDEALATGGLLQSALAVGAAVRISYVTDGDNNPWAQLVTEGRWPFRAADRARWGRRRRGEALAALARLGVSEQHVEFLGFFDQGLTDLLLGGDDRPVRAIAGAIASWRPTVLVAPSPADTHPDHSAVSVLTEFALAGLEPGDRLCRVLRYLIHPEPERARGRLLVRLDREAQDRKRQAVLCHRTQLSWHRRQFLGYVHGSERFEIGSESSARDDAHPVHLAFFSRGALHLAYECRGPVRLGPAMIRVAFETSTGGHARLSIAHSVHPKCGNVLDTLTGNAVGLVSSMTGPRAVRLRLGLEGFAPPRLFFVKLEWPIERRIGLFDSAGWRGVSVPRPNRMEAEQPESMATTRAEARALSHSSAGSPDATRLIPVGVHDTHCSAAKPSTDRAAS